MKEMIEIFPGRWIEVTRRIKEKAGVRLSSRVVATIENGQMARAAQLLPSKNRKYPRLLVEEALEIAHAEGYKAATKATGVHREVIANLHRSKRGCTGKDGTRYTLAQKQACVRLAKELMQDPRTKTVNGWKGGKRVLPFWSHHGAFVEAGRRLGVNGVSIEGEWLRNMIDLNVTPPAPVESSSRQPKPASLGGLSGPQAPLPKRGRGRPRNPASAPPTGS